ncbi:hypothetical protein AQF98_19835 [Pedobacter sp. Hv1]|nr:hypothetical protein AQF98_19835 [Pedobacter sp. Hv1]
MQIFFHLNIILSFIYLKHQEHTDCNLLATMLMIVSICLFIYRLFLEDANMRILFVNYNTKNNLK